MSGTYRKITLADLRAIHDINPNAYGELCRRGFNLVSNPNDWKAPINARIFDCDWEAAALAHAVEFMTATPATVTVIGPYLEVKAIGYRKGPAGDH